MRKTRKGLILVALIVLVAIMSSGCWSVLGPYTTKRAAQGTLFGGSAGYALKGTDGLKVGAPAGLAAGILIGAIEDMFKDGGEVKRGKAASGKAVTDRAPNYGSWAEYKAYMEGRAKAIRDARRAAERKAYEEGRYGR